MSLRAAVYLRKSTDQSDKHESEKSLTHQREQCQALIEKNGWTLAPEHVFTEAEGTSGALHGEGRPELSRLMEAVRSKPRPFDVVVAYDDARLGRDVVMTSYIVKRILDTGARLFLAASGTERRLDSATDALLMSITTFGGQFEREQASLRVRNKFQAKAKDGHSLGTPPYGYRSVEVNGHRELVVDPAQAEVVQSIFERYAEGHGIARIAHELNQTHPGERKWAGPVVRIILRNRVYVGEVLYGKSRFTVNADGKTQRVAVPESEWLRVERPELRVITDQLWRTVEKLQAERKDQYLRTHDGQLNGRPDRESQFLLQGFVVCDLCGSKMVVWSTAKRRTTKGDVTYRYLTCWRHKSRGPAACSNTRGVPLNVLSEMIVLSLKKHVTAASAAQAARELAEDADSSPERAEAKRETLKAELGKVEKRVAKLVEEIVEASDSKALRVALQAAEAKQTELQAKLQQIDSAQVLVGRWAAAGHQERVSTLLADWQSALEGAPVLGRQVLRKLLVAPIRVRPAEDGSVTWATAGSFGRIFGELGSAESAVATVHRAGAAAVDLSRELKALVESVGANGSQGAPATSAPA